MSRLFIFIYEWFERHRVTFYVVLVAMVALCAAMASQMSFQENITNFFGSDNDKKSASFANVAVKDKIVVMINGTAPDAMIASAERFEAEIEAMVESGLISSVTAYADEDTISACTDFVYDHLPIFLTDEEYAAIEANLSDEGIEASVENVYNLLTSPSGMVVGDVVMRDPLNIGTPLLQEFENFAPDMEYEIYEGRLFTADLTTMLIFIEPANGMGDTGSNDALVNGLEHAVMCAEAEGVTLDVIGGPIVAVYNARQIKRDSAITGGIALIVILLVIFLSFRNRRSIPLIIIPPLFGALFALACVWAIQGEISTIAIGAGTVVLGISLSYSIHIVSHLNSCSSPKEILKELTGPLTIGCFTTIGAFAALIFTSSPLLQDMGLFAVFSLIGTTLFSLIFLPHFLRGFDSTKRSPLLGKIEAAVGYRYEGNRWIVLPILLLSVGALFFYDKVEFDEDMSNINYLPEHIAKGEARSMEILGDESNDVYIVTGGESLSAITEEYAKLGALLDERHAEGIVSEVATVANFVIPREEQERRIERWNTFWAEHRTTTLATLEDIAVAKGFKAGAFTRFEELISREYTPCGYTDEEIGAIPVVAEWVAHNEEFSSLMCRVVVPEECKNALYAEVDKLPNTTIIDRSYFSAKMVEATSNDFNYILLVSSLIVFVALFISYGRIELTLLTFLPMAISWVLILGMMALFGIKFNIVNIILATFIFGIGDDFSIFIMDGLLEEYKSGKRVLGAHKTAIFFSAFTAIVGMGVLIFAEHPALKSIALISVLGLSIVVLVSYTIQPLLFRLLVTNHTSQGKLPYTLGVILNTAYTFIYFLVGCIFMNLYALLLIITPIKRSTKKLAFHRFIYLFTRLFLATLFGIKTIRQNTANERFERPAVIIANHQSFADILLLLSTTPKVVMVTNSWVWNSPFFGWVVKYAEFHHAADGYEALAERVKERVSEGYSVVIFPEGTRSADCSVQRFHKGAFYLAQLLEIDILPIVIYGAGHLSAKHQGFYINCGIMATRIMPRIKHGDTTYGTTYQEQTKALRRYFIREYRAMCEEFSRTHNPYFRSLLIRNYIYKGPIMEWYMRIKCRMDGYYDVYDRLIPRDATITDVGAGNAQMDFMLANLAPERTIYAIDYDEGKIEVARNSFLGRRTSIEFMCGDMCTIEFPKSDYILFSDSLHYIDSERQKSVLERAIESLNEGGKIIIRDGNTSHSHAHNLIELTELWSTKLLKFNKTTTDLCFVSEEWMRRFAVEHNMDIEISQYWRYSSETLYILKTRR